MAVIQTEKALNICTKLAEAADLIMRGVEMIVAKQDEKESSGIDLTDAGVEEALGTSRLKHADGTDFNNVISSGAALKTWLETNFHDDVLQKVRNGGV